MALLIVIFSKRRNGQLDAHATFIHGEGTPILTKQDAWQIPEKKKGKIFCPYRVTNHNSLGSSCQGSGDYCSASHRGDPGST